jgi:uncharacterized membrane protein
VTVQPTGPRGASNARLVAVAAYLGGLIAGLIVLVVEKHDRFVRFHAMQSVVTFAGVMVAYLAVTGLPVVGAVFSVPFKVGVYVLWAFLMLKAWQGEPYRLPYVGDFAEHLLK